MKALLVFIIVIASTQSFAQQREDYCVNPERKVFVMKSMYEYVKRKDSKVSDIIPRDDIIVAELVGESEDGYSVVVPCPGVNGISKNRHIVDARLVKPSNLFIPIRNPVKGKTSLGGTSLTAIGINYATSQVLLEEIFLVVNKKYRVVDVDPDTLRRKK